MNDGISGGALAVLWTKYGAVITAAAGKYGLSAVLGMVGAAIMYLALPPTDKDGNFNRKEFVWRLAVAGIFSCLFGDWMMDILQSVGPTWLNPAKHKSAIDLMTGAPAWWISRAVALWFYNRSTKDIQELAKDAGVKVK